MSWPPVSSDEVAELREAEAETSLGSAVTHSPHCQNGWLGEDDDGRPLPCPHCRPHLVTLADGRVVSRSTIPQRHRQGELP
jgi:hypothetical protein